MSNGFFKVTNLGGPSVFGVAPGSTSSFGVGPRGEGGGQQSPVGALFGGSFGTGSLQLGGPGGAGRAIDPQTLLAQILQAGPQADQIGLDAAMGDISSQEATAKAQLQNRFSGMGRPVSSSEYTSQEAQLIDTFRRARDAARAMASQSGLAQYTARINPLLAILQLAQQEFMQRGTA